MTTDKNITVKTIFYEKKKKCTYLYNIVAFECTALTVFAHKTIQSLLIKYMIFIK